MKKKFTLFKICFTILFAAIFFANLLAQKKGAETNPTSDTLALTIKVKPGDYVYPQVIDSMIVYRYNSDIDSFPVSKNVFYQDNELRDTAMYVFEFDTILGVWVKTLKEEIIYNNGEDNPSIKTYEWNEVLQRWINKEWHRNVKNNNLNVYAHYEWNSIINEWVGQRIDSNIIEDGLTKIMFRAFGVDQNNEWIPGYQQEYEHLHYADSTIEIMNRYDYDSQEQNFKQSTREVLVYQFNLLKRIVYYTSDEDSLVLDRLSKYEYDVSGNRTRTEKYEYNHDLKQWEINEFWEYKYNSSGKIIENIWYRWSNTLQSTYPSQKTENTFSNNLIIKSIRYKWNGLELEPDKKYDYNYNSEGKFLSRSDSRWNISELDWNLEKRTDYEYDDKGRSIRETEVEPDNSEEGGERVISNLEYSWITITDKNYLLGYYNYDWDYDLEKFVGSYATQNTFDEQGNRTSYVSLRWDIDNDDWSKYRRTNYFFSELPDESSKTNDTIFINDPVIVYDTIFQDLDTINVVIYDTVKVVDTVTVTVTDTSILSSIETVQTVEKEISLYPNPAKTHVFLENPWDNDLIFEIYSLDGRILNLGTIHGKGVRKKINLNEFKPGYYIILIYDQNNFFKQLRFVKQ